MGVLKVLGAGEDSLLELMLLVVDMEATEQLEERSSLLPPLEVDRLSANTPTRSPVSGFTEIARVLSSLNNAALLAGFVLFKTCKFFRNKEQKWQFFPQIKNIWLHFSLWHSLPQAHKLLLNLSISS